MNISETVVNGFNSPIKRHKITDLDPKAEAILLLHTRNTPQLQRQTLPQSKGLGKDFPIKWI